jgi:hypothetical protein
VLRKLGTNGKPIMSVVGINKISQYPSIIAQWLGKSDFKLYTSHCFRRTAASLFADSGCSLPLMKIAGNWKSSTVCERYIAESSLTKRKIGEQLGLNDDQKENSPPQKAPKTSPDIVSGQQLVLHNPLVKLCFQLRDRPNHQSESIILKKVPHLSTVTWILTLG